VSASEHTIALGDINDDGVNDFAMLTWGSSAWYASDNLIRTDVFSGADVSTDGAAELIPIAVDDDADDWRYRWPSSPMGDLDGDGIDEMFLDGNDGGMLVRSTDWPSYLASGELPSSGPGRYGGNGPNVLFAPIETEDGPSVLLAAQNNLADSLYQLISTRPGSELDHAPGEGWGSGGALSWPHYDLWVYHTMYSMRPIHVFTVDLDADGLGDVVTVKNNSFKVYLASSRPASSYVDYDEYDFIIEGPEDPEKWIQERSGGKSRKGLVTADFNGDGHVDLATVDREAGEFGNGRAYITSGSAIADGSSRTVGDIDTIIDGGDLGSNAVLQVSLGGDIDHDGLPDLWVVGVDHEVDSSTQQARFFSGATIVDSGVLDMSDAEATWRPPASEYTAPAGSDLYALSGEVWVSAPGDLDGDGFEDALLGATGQIWLITNLEL